MKKPTDKQNDQALKILIHESYPGFEACLIITEERETKKWEPDSREWWVLPAFVIDDRYWCGWDVAFGHDIVVDFSTRKAWTSGHGIFTDDFVFISDYYGYSDGAFYYRKQ